jgi:hypothetical protein
MLENHISIERMMKVVTDCEAVLTDWETQHIRYCADCLATFGELVLVED